MATSARLVATLLKKGVPLLSKTNMPGKTHPYISKFRDYPNLCAESRVVLAYGLTKCEGYDILVTRYAQIRLPYAGGRRRDVKYETRMTMSLPCKSCMEVIKTAKIRRIYYSDWEGEIQMIKVKDL